LCDFTSFKFWCCNSCYRFCYSHIHTYEKFYHCFLKSLQ
jgi:hypothetical protein